MNNRKRRRAKERRFLNVVRGQRASAYNDLARRVRKLQGNDHRAFYKMLGLVD